MQISTIKQFRFYIQENSGFSLATINNLINALGFFNRGSFKALKELSSELENCAQNGANIGICGFSYFSETIPFFLQNRQDIVKHMENMASELGTDIISMVQGFGVFRREDKPTVSEIGKALWGSGSQSPELNNLYNVFAWYVLEEISNTWLRYLEENPDYYAKMSA